MKLGRDERRPCFRDFDIHVGCKHTLATTHPGTVLIGELTDPAQLFGS